MSQTKQKKRSSTTARGTCDTEKNRSPGPSAWVQPRPSVRTSLFIVKRPLRTVWFWPCVFLQAPYRSHDIPGRARGVWARLKVIAPTCAGLFSSSSSLPACLSSGVPFSGFSPRSIRGLGLGRGKLAAQIGRLTRAATELSAYTRVWVTRWREGEKKRLNCLSFDVNGYILLVQEH